MFAFQTRNGPSALWKMCTSLLFLCTLDHMNQPLHAFFFEERGTKSRCQTVKLGVANAPNSIPYQAKVFCALDFPEQYLQLVIVQVYVQIELCQMYCFFDSDPTISDLKESPYIVSKPFGYKGIACINAWSDAHYDVYAATRHACSPLPAWIDVFLEFPALSPLWCKTLSGFLIKLQSVEFIMKAAIMNQGAVELQLTWLLLWLTWAADICNAIADHLDHLTILICVLC